MKPQFQHSLVLFFLNLSDNLLSHNRCWPKATSPIPKGTTKVLTELFTIFQFQQKKEGGGGKYCKLIPFSILFATSSGFSRVYFVCAILSLTFESWTLWTKLLFRTLQNNKLKVGTLRSLFFLYTELGC